MSVYFDKSRGGYRYTFYSNERDPITNRKKRITSKIYDTEKEAIEAQGIETETIEAGGKKTFKEAYTAYLNDMFRISKINKRSMNEKKKIFEKRFYSWENIWISDITKVMVRDRLNAGDISQLAINTQNKYRALLHGLFEWCIENYSTPRKNPVVYKPSKRTKDGKSVKETRRKPIALSEDEIDSFLSCLPNDMYRAFFSSMAYYGLRKNEAQSLTFADIELDDDRPRMHIWRQWYNDGEEEGFNELKSKRSERYLTITKEYAGELLKLRESYKANLKNGEKIESMWVFGGRKRLARTTIDRVKNKAIKESGVRDFVVHDLRHSAITRLSAHYEFNPALLSAFAGHSTRMTEVYIHIPGYDAATALETILNKKQE